MSNALIIFALLMGGATVSAQDPFSRYIASVKQHHPETRLRDFAQSCGVSIEQPPTYGVSVGGAWSKTWNLAKSVHDTESDIVDTAAIWTEAGVPRLIDLWSLSLDTGSEVNSFFCLGGPGRVRRLQITQWEIPVDGSRGWIYTQHELFDEAGKVKEKDGGFVDENGKPVPRPKLDGDDGSSFAWIPDMSIVGRIENELLGRGESQQRLGQANAAQK